MKKRNVVLRNFKQILFLWILSLVGFLTLSGCVLDLEIFNPHLHHNHNRVDPDLLDGEVFRTKNGVEFRGAFKEISNKIQLPNGVVFDGAFYD